MAEQFHWADYLIFGLSLAVSLAIGVFFAVTGNRQKSTEDFLLGGRDMNVMPVAMSILASALNAVFILGIPAEIHYFGLNFTLVGFSFLLTGVFLAQVYVPIFHRMRLTSAYEYFEKRYKFYPLRVAASLTFIVAMLLFLAVVLYAPALAFSQVTSFTLASSVVSCGIVATLYTGFGGMKAVIWTDTLQMAIMLIGVFVLIVVGGVKAGSPSEIWNILEQDGRINFNNWDPDMKVRHTVWGLIIGQTFIWSAALGASQMTIQRFFAIKKLRDAQIAIYLAIGAAMLLIGLVSTLGIVIHATYHGCDPTISGDISKPDQIVPFFLMDVIGHLHGLPGLFTASVFAAALSSVSSAINSLAAVILEDFVRPGYRYKKGEDIPPNIATWVSKGIAIFFGLFTVALSFAAEYMGDVIVQIPGTIWGTMGSPLLGAFTLGIFVPFSGGLATMIAMLFSEAFGLWMGIGGIVNGAKPTPIRDGLFTVPNCTPSSPPYVPPTGAMQEFWDVSYCWYGLITFLMTIVLGIILSIIFDGCKIKKKETDLTLTNFKFGQNCLCCLGDINKTHIEEEETKGDMEMGSDNVAYSDDERKSDDKTKPEAGEKSSEKNANGTITPLPAVDA